ncbi:hypothetical protein [Yersinia rochesterensis]|uniref:Uncharacterized protein n=1 Tax=Yersinia rochesterensis TaxID=1604335 RepID=A0A8D4SS15_9GAMM|nr:hypothetical protein [Yersinia rochesterensis]AYD43805.1 hypothetical protein DXZ79_08885 [Yersinia rochesterensis]MDN0105690.1 hypothetical protein [Yersinia rochesterensis]
MHINFRLYLLAIITLFVVIYPCLIDGTFSSYDAMAHYGRLKDINNQIMNLQIPPLFDYYSDDWYGLSWNMFYPPLSVYVMGLVKFVFLFSLSEQNQFKISVAVIIIICFISMYISAMKLHKNNRYAIIAAILFSTSGYLLSDAYIRIDLGELLAMAFAPMLIVGSRALISGDEGKALFPISLSLILISNIPSFIASILYLTLLFLINIKKLIDIKTIKYLIISVFFVILSTAFFTVPLIYHFIKGNVFAFHALAVSYNTMGKFGVEISEMIFGTKSQTGLTTKGILISSGIIINIIFIFYIVRDAKKSNHVDLSILSICLLFLIASTNIFPWYMVSEKIPVVRFLQFPWRLMVICVPAMVLLLVYSLKSINSKSLNFLIIISALITSFYPMHNSIINRTNEIPHHEFHDYMTTVYEKNKNNNIDTIRNLKSNKKIEISNIKNGDITFTVDSESKKEITLPIMAYDGYKVTNNDLPIDYTQSDNGLILIKNPSNGIITVSYNKMLTTIPFFVSFVFIVSCFIYLRVRSGKKKI